MMNEQQQRTSGVTTSGVTDRTGRARRKTCCSVLYSAYYFANSPKDVTVLASSLHASPAWLDMVRQMNRDVVCDSIAWTDFSLTTETAYLCDEAVRGVTERNTHGNSRDDVVGSSKPGSHEDRDEHERGSVEPSRPRVVETVTVRESVGFSPCPRESDEECIPPQAKRILRRHFYDEFCHRLVTAYGVPTLLVYRDRLRRGLELNEDDQNHRWFVDSMLLDVRFVAAVEITCPTETTPRPVTVEDGRRQVTATDTTAGENSASVGVQDGMDDRAEQNRQRETGTAPRHDYSFDDSGDYMFDEYEVNFPRPVEPHLLQAPHEITTMSEREISDILDKYEIEMRATKPDYGRPATVSTGAVVEHDKAETHENVSEELSTNDDAMEIDGSGNIDSPTSRAAEDSLFGDDSSPDPTVNIPYHGEGVTNAELVFMDDTSVEISHTGIGEIGDGPNRDSEERNGGGPLPTFNAASGPMSTEGAVAIDSEVEYRKASVSATNTDPGQDEFKRPFDVDHHRSSSRRRRLFRDLGNREYKENLDTSDKDDERVLSDTSSDDDVWRSHGTGSSRVVKSRRARDSSRFSRDNDLFDLVSVDLTSADTIVPDSTQLAPGTLLFLYRLERRSGNVIRFVRVASIAAARTVPPVDLDSVKWETEELMREMQKMFGDQVTWLGRRREDPEAFQIRNVPVDVHFRDTVPNLSVLLRRTRRALVQSPVRV